MQPQIQIQEPFSKSWSEPQIIVTREDILNYENSQEKNCVAQRGMGNKSQNQSLSLTGQAVARQTETEILQERLMDLRSSLLQSHFMTDQLHTPKKCYGNTNDSCLVFCSDVSTTHTQVCDRIIPQHSLSRSLPSSPINGQTPYMTSSPKMPSTERHFSFVPERLRFLEETRQLPESDEVDNGFRLSQGYCNSPQGPRRCTTSLHRLPISPVTERTIDSLYFKPDVQLVDTPSLKAKRKLDMDDPFPNSVKRAKSDVSQEAGLRYVNQLEMDLMALKHRIQSSRPEKSTSPLNCACAIMEKHFMEMATSAYKSIRRYDGTIHSFEQFKEELTQTNKVITDSMELLQNVRRLCVHCCDVSVKTC